MLSMRHCGFALKMISPEAADCGMLKTVKRDYGAAAGCVGASAAVYAEDEMKKRFLMYPALLCWALIMILSVSCIAVTGPGANEGLSAGQTGQPEISPNGGNQGVVPERTPSAAVSGKMQVHFIDVGQGDCILIRSGEQAMLIDAGENQMGDRVVDYLKAQGVAALQYVIGTHPHSDHIGGLDTVISAFSVEKVILPKVAHNTKTYEDVLLSVAAKGLKVTAAKAGDTYSLGEARFDVIAPCKDYGDDLNNWSVGIRLLYGDTIFIMCGDAEAGAEADMLASGADLRADVLKVGHHGSDTSTSEAFLAAVDPAYAVIQCGAGNSYGHPVRSTLDRLVARGITVLRTDEIGTIVAYCDGTNISWNQDFPESTDASPAVRTPAAETSDADPTPAATRAAQAEVYVLNTNTKKFHLPGCSSVRQISDNNRGTFTGDRETLMAQGYAPCKSCNP